MLNKAFHVNFSDIDYNESVYNQRIFAKLSIKEMKEYLLNRKLPEFQNNSYDDSFPGCIALEEGNCIIITLKTDKKASIKEKVNEKI